MGVIKELLALFTKRRLMTLFGMWLLPGPIIIPIAMYFVYKWRSKRSKPDLEAK